MIKKITQKMLALIFETMVAKISKESVNYLYPAEFKEEEDGSYSVKFLDLKGCVTQGESFEEAYYNAREALSGIIESHIENKLPLPEISKKSIEAAKNRANVKPVAPMQDTMLPLMIRGRRKELKLTQKDMAKKLKVSQQAYQRLEDPTHFNATTKKLEQIEKVLKINLLPMAI